MGFTTYGSDSLARAADADWVPVSIRNGNFAANNQTGAFTATAPDYWTNEYEDGTYSPNPTLVVSAAAAAHPRGFQAVALNGNARGVLQTRLWGVRKGTAVEVRFDAAPASPSVQSCAAQVRNYKVASATGATEYAAQQYSTPASGWAPAAPFTFTAQEDHPKVVFSSLVDGKCGALITNVTVKADRTTFPKPDQFIKRNDLPWAAYRALKLTNVPDWATVMADNGSNTANNTGKIDPTNDYCTTSASCYFAVDASGTYKYFAENRILKDFTYFNCTRNPVTDKRTASWTEEGFDPFGQEANRAKNYLGQKSNNTGIDDYEIGKPTTLANGTNTDERFKAVQAGFQRYDLNVNLANTETPLDSPRTSTQDISVQIQPGEASWIEVQPARERIAGVFSGAVTDNKNAANVTTGKGWYSIDTMVDLPSADVPDRVYQRTGPLTETERQHCTSERPLLVTPDNEGSPATPRAVAAPAGSALVEQQAGAPVRGTAVSGARVTRLAPLSPPAP
ncbi:hypothetical protein [Streptomyces sp. NPDC089919]|uniref:hypothetical protein n=1 Tax=Streptomyces sp. NPDC089919 TaxID=3155188 RepID=UPI00342B1A41